MRALFDDAGDTTEKYLLAAVYAGLGISGVLVSLALGQSPVTCAPGSPSAPKRAPGQASRWADASRGPPLCPPGSSSPDSPGTRAPRTTAPRGSKDARAHHRRHGPRQRHRGRGALSRRAPPSVRPGARGRGRFVRLVDRVRCPASSARRRALGMAIWATVMACSSGPSSR